MEFDARTIGSLRSTPLLAKWIEDKLKESHIEQADYEIKPEQKSCYFKSNEGVILAIKNIGKPPGVFYTCRSSIPTLEVVFEREDSSIKPRVKPSGDGVWHTWLDRDLKLVSVTNQMTDSGRVDQIVNILEGTVVIPSLGSTSRVNDTKVTYSTRNFEPLFLAGFKNIENLENPLQTFHLIDSNDMSINKGSCMTMACQGLSVSLPAYLSLMDFLKEEENCSIFMFGSENPSGRQFYKRMFELACISKKLLKDFELRAMLAFDPLNSTSKQVESARIQEYINNFIGLTRRPMKISRLEIQSINSIREYKIQPKSP